MNKIIDNNFIVAVSNSTTGEQITETEYNTILSIIHNRPTAPAGYTYKLKADTLKWQLVEMPEPSAENEEANESDYIDALNTLGVDTNEKN